MTVSVVQSGEAGAAAGGGWNVTLGTPATAGNTLFYVVSGFHGSSITPSSSAPTLGGSSVTGAALIASAVNSATSQVLTDIWMLPNIPGGQTACSVTVTNSLQIDAVGLAVFEVAGLGATPAVDQAYPTPAPPATGNSGNLANPNAAINSGTTGAITAAPEFVIGGGTSDQGAAAGAAAFTSQAVGGNTNAWAGYQIPVIPGGTYTWAQTAAGNANWSAAVVTVKPPGGAPAAHAIPPGGGSSMFKRSMLWADL